MPAVILSGVLAVVFAIYSVVALTRRRRLQAAARVLDAQYIDEGWFRPGRLSGRGFTIRIVAVRRSFFTDIEVETARTPGSYFVDAGFFEKWPAWDHVRVPGRRRERAFVVGLSVPGYVPPDDAQRDALWRWLTRGGRERRLSSTMLDAANVRRITIDDRGVSTSFGGIVSDAGRLGRAVDLLKRLVQD
jgi:hypothetical protein